MRSLIFVILALQLNLASAAIICSGSIDAVRLPPLPLGQDGTVSFGTGLKVITYTENICATVCSISKKIVLEAEGNVISATSEVGYNQGFDGLVVVFPVLDAKVDNRRYIIRCYPE